MYVKKSSNEESLELPSYLSSGKYYQQSPRNPNPYPSRKCFPRHKYGVSSDAPAEFQTKNSLLSAFTNKSVLFSDASVRHEKPDKILTKGLMGEWPLQKNTQTSDINSSLIPHKFATKSVKSNELYNCILHNSKTVQRPDLVVGEETYYTAKYHDSVKENKTFHKKAGYFQEFINHHKTTKEEYKTLQVDGDDHNRYTSKPIIFTNTRTKNTLSKHITQDHTKILQNIKDRKSCSPKKQKRVNLSQLEESEIPKPTDKDKQSVRFKSFMEDSGPVENGQNVLETHKSFYANYIKKPPVENRQGSQAKSQLNGIDLIESKRWSSVQPMRHSNSVNNDAQEYRSRKSPNSSMLSFEKGSSNQSQQDFLRYNTKKAAENISNNREQAIKGEEPLEFLKHIVENDNRRNSDIEVSVAQKNRKLAKIGDGNAVRYSSVPHRRPKEMHGVTDNIQRFEKHIEGLRTATANFGHQRWFYDKNWKIKPLKHIDMSALNKSAIGC